MTSPSTPIDQLDAMKVAYEALQGLDSTGRSSALSWLAQALEVEAPATMSQGATAPGEALGKGTAGAAGGNVVPTPKQFMAEKAPTNDVHRVACLAYYLAHYRATQFFKTVDLTKLNTEAAGHKFGNPSQAVTNAMKISGLLVPGSKSGTKQISTKGEAVVEAMPDAEAVKAAAARFPAPKRRAKRTPAAKPK